MEEKGIVRSVRGDKETFERLADITKAQFANQGEALAAIIAAWDLQQAKTATPNRKTEIEDFDAHLQALSTAYVHSLQIAESADTRARNALDAELASKDALIRDLQAQLEVARTSAKLAEQERKEAETETRNVKKALETAERQASDANARADAAERRAAAQIADKEKLVNSLTAQVSEMSERTRKNAAAAERAAELQAARDAAEAEVLRLKNKLETEKALAEIALEKAVAAAERAAQQEAAEIQETTNETIKGLYKQINQLIDRVTTAEAKAADAAPTNDRQTPPAPAEDTDNADMAKKRKNKAAKKQET